jgi:hypothetical protein
MIAAGAGAAPHTGMKPTLFSQDTVLIPVNTNTTQETDEITLGCPGAQRYCAAGDCMKVVSAPEFHTNPDPDPSSPPNSGSLVRPIQIPAGVVPASDIAADACVESSSANKAPPMSMQPTRAAEALNWSASGKLLKHRLSAACSQPMGQVTFTGAGVELNDGMVVCDLLARGDGEAVRVSTTREGVAATDTVLDATLLVTWVGVVLMV